MDWITSHTQHAQVIETSAKGEDDSNAYTYTPESSRFIKSWEPDARGTGDLFASYLIAAVAKGCIFRRSRETSRRACEKNDPQTRETGSESLILP